MTNRAAESGSDMSANQPHDALPQAARTFSRAVDAVAKGLLVVAAVGTVVLMLMTVIDVTQRYIRGGSLPGVLEYTEVILVGVAFAGMGIAKTDQVHVKVSLFTDRLPPRISGVLQLVGAITAVLFLFWLAYLTGIDAVESFRTGETRFGLFRVPVWPARIFVPIGLSILGFQYLRDAVMIYWHLRRGNRELAAQHPLEPL